jgi:hypothetical protein
MDLSRETDKGEQAEEWLQTHPTMDTLIKREDADGSQTQF